MSWAITPAQKTDPDALAYLAEVERADGQALESGVRDAVIAFVAGCKTDGIWTAIKAGCILSGARTLNGALVSLTGRAPTNFNFVSGDYNRKTGLVGNGSTKYLNSNRAGNADPQNSQHISVYASTAATSAAGKYPFYIGFGSGSTGSTHIGRLESNGNLFTRNRTATFDSASASSAGFLATARSSASEYVTRFGGVSRTITAASQTPASGNVLVFWSDGAFSTDFADARIAFYSAGESLDLSKLETRVSTLITAFGAAIP
jgi:hypothetical protein